MSAQHAFTLPTGHLVEVDSLDKAAWHAVLDRFSDASIYQCWHYAGPGASRLVLSRDGEIVAAAQVRIMKVPLLRLGVAYVRWGPMWRARGRDADPSSLQAALAAIRTEYALRRGLTVRILPYFLSDEHAPFHSMLGAMRFERVDANTPQRTLVLPLGPALAELRAGFDQKWRNCLNRAERNGLVVEHGTGDALFERFLGIHAQMHARKRFVAGSDAGAFRELQRKLPERHRMQVFLASAQGRLAAGAVFSQIGDFGVYLHGATSDAGMPTNASYLLQWHALAWLKANGAVSYNLHGINPLTNPGTHRFKAGLSGRAGRDVHYLGTYDCSDAPGSRALLRVAESARRTYYHSRLAIRQLQAGASR